MRELSPAYTKSLLKHPVGPDEAYLGILLSHFSPSFGYIYACFCLFCTKLPTLPPFPSTAFLFCFCLSLLFSHQLDLKGPGFETPNNSFSDLGMFPKDLTGLESMRGGVAFKIISRCS